MADLDPLFLQDVLFLCAENCPSTSVGDLTIHPVMGICAKLRRGDTSFNLELRPNDFLSFKMAESLVFGENTSNNTAIHVIRLELSSTAAERLRHQFVRSLHVANPFRSSSPNGTAGESHLGHAIVIGLKGTDAGKKSFDNILTKFSTDERLSGDNSFLPVVIKSSEMTALLGDCFEILESMVHAHVLCNKEQPAVLDISSGVESRGRASLKRTSANLSPPPITVVAKRSCEVAVGTNRRSTTRKIVETSHDLTLDNDDAPEYTISTCDSTGRAEDEDVPLLRHPLPIYQRDLECLKPGYYINDTIVDFYLRYLVENFEAKNGVGKAFAFSSLFYSQLTRLPTHDQQTSNRTNAAERRYENVRNWVRKLYDLFDTTYIFIPVNFNQHWMLVIVQHIKLALKSVKTECDIKSEPANGNNGNCSASAEAESKKTPAIIVMDSMVAGNPVANAHYHIARYVRQFLECCARHRNLELDSNRLVDIRPRVPQQVNATDCALFIFQYVESFLENPPSFSCPGESNGASSDKSSSEPTLDSKKTSSCVLLIVRESSAASSNDASATSTTSVRRVVPAQTSGSTVKFAQISPKSHTTTPNLVSWFPPEQVAKKRQEILQLLEKRIEKAASS